MLVIKGRAGKASVIAERFIADNTFIVETHDGALSKLITDEELELNILQIPSNSPEEQDRIIDVLTNFYNSEEGQELGYVNVIFYLNVDEDRIEAFKYFEDSFYHFDLVRVILTVQADNEELEYYMYGNPPMGE